MTPRARHLGAAMAVLLAAVAACAWWLDARTLPDHVGPRFVDELVQRHAGTTVLSLDRGAVRAALPSGVYVDVDLPRVFATCRASRLHCAQAIDDALDDVDRSEAASRQPQAARIRPVVVAESGGFRYGYVSDPLVGPLEVRYALVDGVAATFATATIVERLGLSRTALRDAALAGLRGDADVALERIDVKGATLFRVRSSGDPVASLLDRERMSRFADDIGAHRLFGIVPLRGTLVLAAASDAAGRALQSWSTQDRGTTAKSVDSGVIAYDIDAPEGHALTVAILSTALPPP
jgi:hypothetical protein